MVEIKESDLRVEYYRGSGPGGQHRNVTESCVRIRHLPTGIVVQACEHRSQARNRELALARLQQVLQRRQQRQKRRVASPVPKGEKERRLSDKKRVALKKRLRSTAGDE
ncbi:hydrolase [Geotalea uraniireducens]|uniref:Hydrolase n=1 Tax=Geotalea uraniireducens TaxID=351604 RepID=A0ABN6VWD4_9BACT|nr:peptide chain release factor-like protein [Geotalea uraniireducens]BDV43301.1 hydrolase [Geotalea uraniireducens]